MGWDPGSWGPEVSDPPGGPPAPAVGDRGPPPGPPPAPRTRPETPPGLGGSGRVTRGRPDPPGGSKTPKKGGFLPPPGGVQKRGKMPPKKRELIVRLFGRGFCTFRGGCSFGGFFAPQNREYPDTPPGG